MSWDDDKRDPFVNATREPVPLSMTAANKKNFGIESSTQFSTTSLNFGCINRNTSQTNKLARGIQPPAVQSTQNRTRIIPGQSLSTNQKPTDNYTSANTVLRSANSGDYGSSTFPRTNSTWEKLAPAGTAQNSNRYRSSEPTAPASLDRLSTSTQKSQIRYGSTRSNQCPPVDSLATHSAAPMARDRAGQTSNSPAYLAQKQEEFSLRSKGALSVGAQHNQQSRLSSESAQRPRRSTRRSSGVNEVIDLVDDDDDDDDDAEEAACQDVAGIREGNGGTGGSVGCEEDIFKAYASIPGVRRPEGELTRPHCGYGATEEPVAVGRIYLGVRGFRGSEARPVYVRVDCGVNECLLLALGEEGEQGAAPGVVMEEIPFAKIKKFICGRLRREEYHHEALLSVSVNGNLTLRSAGVGNSCMLSPTMAHNNDSCVSAKNILMMMSAEALDTLRGQLARVPAWSKRADKMVTYYAQGAWPTSTLKEVAMPHMATIGVSWEVLRKDWRDRAAKELDQRQRSERRRQRSARLLGEEPVDPTDCEPYTVYPIEPEVIDAITIFKGDLKRLRPEEYLNDNLIDLQIKYLVRTALSETQQSRVHAFNCQFYSRLTTHERDMRLGHQLVARWTKSVDLFDRDFVLIPINYSYHWSLAVIIRPGAVLPMVEALQAGDLTQLLRSPPASQSSGSGRKKGARQQAAADVQRQGVSPVAGNTGESAIVVEGDSEQQLQSEPDAAPSSTSIAKTLFSPAAAISLSCSPMEDQQEELVAAVTTAAAAAAAEQHMPCILHMDSLGMHGSVAIGKRLKNYLMLEWEARKMPTLDAGLDSRVAALRQERLEEDDSAVPLDAADEARLRKALEARRRKVFEEIPVVKCKVPMQANGYDCGLFVTKFAEMVLRRAPSSTAADIESKFSALLPATDFSQADVEAERLAMRQRIDLIKTDRDKLKHELRERKARDAALRQQQDPDVAAGTTSPSSSARSGASEGEGEGEGAAPSEEDEGAAGAAPAMPLQPLPQTPGATTQAIRGIDISQLEAEVEAAAATQASDFDALMLQDHAAPSRDDIVGPTYAGDEKKQGGYSSSDGERKGKAKKSNKRKKDQRRGSEDCDFPSRSGSGGSDASSTSDSSRSGKSGVVAEGGRMASALKRPRQQGDVESGGRSKAPRRGGAGAGDDVGLSGLVDRMFQGGPTSTPQRTVDAFVAQHAPSSAMVVPTQVGMGGDWPRPQAGEEEDIGEEVDLAQVRASAQSGPGSGAGGKVRYATGAEAARAGTCLAPREKRA